MAAIGTSSITLPKEVQLATIGKLKDSSTIAALTPAEPMLFQDVENLYFSAGVKGEVVGEGAAKSYSNPTIAQVPAKIFKVHTTTRVNAELKWADEDARMGIIQAITEDQFRACGETLDYVVYHAINPLPGTALGSGYTALTAMSGVHSVSTASDPVVDWDAMLAQLTNYAPTGVALSRTQAAAMRGARDNLGHRMWPDLPVNLNMTNVDGIAAAVSNSVYGSLAGTPPQVLAIMGDFSAIKWGMVRDPKAEVIEYGDPDGQGDLKRYNQIAYRVESVFAYAVLDADAFAVLS